MEFPDPYQTVLLSVWVTVHYTTASTYSAWGSDWQMWLPVFWAQQRMMPMANPASATEAKEPKRENRSSLASLAALAGPANVSGPQICSIASPSRPASNLEKMTSPLEKAVRITRTGLEDLEEEDEV